MAETVPPPASDGDHRPLMGSARPPAGCPYVGLMPFDEQDERYFFGRDNERDIIAANLSTSRLTILYARSGVGKSSLLRAGLLPLARGRARERFEDLHAPGVATAYVRDWSHDPLEALGHAVVEAVNGTPGSQRVPVGRGERFRPEWLTATIADSGVSGVHLVLDQVEEYFRYHPQETDDAGLVVTLSAILTDPRFQRVNVLLAIREDALALLDRFKGRIPRVFNNYYRLPPLTQEAARTAIERPLEIHNALVPPDKRVSVQPELVEGVLDQVRMGRITVAEDPDEPAGAGASFGGEPDEIETPYLQLVMTTLWEQEQALGSEVLRLSTLEHLGGAETIVHRHLDQVMGTLAPAQQDVAAEVFLQLVTSSGAKFALSASDLAERSRSNLPAESFQDVLDSLAAGERLIVRAVEPPVGQADATRYEIFHDVLGAAVLDWRRRYVEEQRRRSDQLALAGERRRLRRTRLVAASLGAMLLLMSVLVGVSIEANRRANQQSTEAAKQRQLGEMTALLTSDPTQSLRLAVAAYRQSPDAETEGAVLRANGAVKYQILGETDNDAADRMLVTPDGTKAVALRQDDAGVLSLLVHDLAEADPLNGNWVATSVTLRADEVVYDAELDQDGSRLAITTTRKVGYIVDVAGEFGDGDAEAPRRATKLEMPPNELFRAAFVGHAGSELVAAIPLRGRIWVFDSTSGEPKASLKGSKPLAAATSGTSPVTIEEPRKIVVWDPENGEPLFESGLLPSGLGVIQSVAAFDGDGSDTGTFVGVVAPPGEELGLVVWDWGGGDDRAKVYEGPAHDGTTAQISFDYDHKFVTVAYDRTVRQFDLKRREWRLGPQSSVVPDLADSVTAALTTTRRDGIRLITGVADGRVLYWSTKGSAGPLYELLGHRGPVTELAWRGRRIVSFGADGTVRVWTLPIVHRDNSHDEPVTALNTGSESRYIVSTSVARASLLTMGKHKNTDEDAFKELERTIKDVKESKLRQVLLRPGEPPESIVLYEGGKRPILVRWTADGGRKLRKLEAANARITSIALSADGRFAIGGDESGRLNLWEIESGKRVQEDGVLRAGSGEWRDLAFDQSGSRVASASPKGIALIGLREGTSDIRVEDAAGSREGRHPFTTVAFSADGRRLAATDEIGDAYVWQVGAKTADLVTDTPLTSPASIHGHAALNRDGTLLAAGDATGLIQVWDVDSGQVIFRSHRHAGSVNDVQFFKNGKDTLLLTASDDRTAAVVLCEVCSDRQGVLDDADNWVDQIDGVAARD